MSVVQSRVWSPGWDCALTAQLADLRRGAGDPTHRVTSDGTWWRASLTPEGPATVRLRQPRGVGTQVEAQSWGPGAEWALDHVPWLLGDGDDPRGFEPAHPVLSRAAREFGVPRFGRTDRVFEALLPAILEQKVTSVEAWAGFRSLVRGFGERAPGAPHEVDLWLPPTPRAVASVPSWDWLAAHVDRARSRTAVRSATVAASVERLAGGTDAEGRLRSLPGVGEWTAAEVRRRAWGDPDAVSFGDYHVAKDVGWALTGELVDDDGLRELLTPWHGHRARVVTLLMTAGLRRPRHGPRMAPRTHLPAPTPGTRHPRRR